MSHRAWRGLGLGVLLALPALWAGWQWQVLLGSGWSSWLGANPVEATIHWSGLWAMRILIFTLALSPLAPLKPLAWLRGHRRLFGLAAFGYATAHLLLYVGLDQGWALPAILRELIKRWYLTLGISAWLILVPLAVTSTRGWMIRLKKQWRILHWGVYPAAALAVTHEALVGKVLSTEAAVSISIVVLLAALRLYGAARRRLPVLKLRAMRDARPATR